MQVVYPRDGGPVFVFVQPRHGEERLFPGVGPVPVFLDQVFVGVRRVAKHVVVGVRDVLLDGLDLPADGYHRLAKAIDLALVFALGRFNHKGVGHRE